ncbi:hypothetical protein [Actinomycetospora sp.]|uniref:hypothetical protein n=1 Tax=Actinomycetospora sp. TaxID=1872135 RepID=UPI002F403B24
MTRWTRDPFRGSWAVLDGRTTWTRLRGPDFRQLRPDVYVGAAAEQDLRMCVRGLRLWSQDLGILAGPLAALAYEAECPWDDAELIMPGRCHPAPSGTRIRTDRLSPDEIAERFGCPITSPVRTAFDLARREPLVEAVAAVDSLAHTCRFPSDYLRRFAAGHPRARGIVQVRRVLELMDPRAESLPETRLRLGLLDRGVPPGVPQYRVRLLTGERKRLDLAWPEAMVALEYDGPGHRTITGQNRDAFHRGRLGDLGWNIGVVTSAMIADPVAFDELAARVLRQLG